MVGTWGSSRFRKNNIWPWQQSFTMSKILPQARTKTWDGGPYKVPKIATSQQTATNFFLKERLPRRRPASHHKIYIAIKKLYLLIGDNFEAASKFHLIVWKLVATDDLGQDIAFQKQQQYIMISLARRNTKQNISNIFLYIYMRNRQKCCCRSLLVRRYFALKVAPNHGKQYGELPKAMTCNILKYN